ncbi:pyruvate dehydrogenase complex dihydrolipoamide acetyltransferase [Alphaproteobacteria bacterium]|jgi:pyruvate dehydrogenase E2 component (dihydrolipoamide acetyltransferase)|nr:pyruvate dehydrogenase complex dihydrolipoamide acetyltransferase [Alphaproteobacteria bacterium]
MSIDILMPALSPTMEEGTLSKWLVKEGDNVVSGDLIAEIETDKATMEVETIEDGIVGKLLVQEGEEAIKVNSVIAILIEEGETLKGNEPPLPKNELKSEASSNNNLEIKLDNSTNSKLNIEVNKDNLINKDANRIFISPLAKRLAKQLDINLKLVNGSGPNGRIVKFDIENFDHNKKENINNISLSEDNFEIIKNTSMRKTIAARLVKSKNEAPHFYLSLDCNLDKLLEIRASINTKSNDKYKISVNDMIIKAASASLIKVPKANASWENENTKYYKNTDISVAVAIDGGLITPIVRNVQSKGLYDISSDMKYLSSKAKEGKLLPEEYIGGSFSISNLGMFGIKQFSAVINPPQGAILAVGAGERKAIVINENISIATVMSVTLSCDHRVIDGAVGAEFLSVFKEYIENPSLMLL